MTRSKLNSRALAATTLDQVVRHSQHLDQALDKNLGMLAIKKDHSFTQELCYGVMRWYPRLQFIVDSLLDKPLKSRDTNITLLIMLGIYQIDFMRTPPHAAVSSTVDACKELNKDWAKKLVNAVLRRYQREKPEFQSLLENEASALFAHPSWLIEKLQDNWPQHWQALLESNNTRPPMHLRVNLQQTSRQEYLDRLGQEGIPAIALPLSDSAVKLEKPLAVSALPGFSEGEVSVQDQGAQLAVDLLDLHAGHHVLDACAAPGGKAAHILEKKPAIEKLVALDRNPARVALLRETKKRLDLPMQIHEADAGAAESWWDKGPFDRILLDAPCSASGIIRRHPDIKILRQAEQVSSLAKPQSDLLQALWPLLKPGGRMVYSTCSVFQDENDAQIMALLDKTADAKILSIAADWGIETSYGRQSLPVLDDTDGFYYAVLEKTHASLV